jgi:NAD(P)-dependent dehydrogenase (short-subunit alcohol dehydrogenase family)
MKAATWTAVLAGATAVAVARRMRNRPAQRDGVALVTGGSRGLGLLIARQLAARGFRLVICARDAAELAEAESDLAGRGADVFAVRCDVADRGQVDQMVQSAVDRFGRLDVLVNNAGIIEVAPVAAMTVEDFADAHAVMFWGTLYPTLAALPHLREQRHGRIINITSIGGKISAPHLLPYNCAKFAAVGFSEGLRAELSGTGVTVTTVVPGLMRTGSHLRAHFKGQRRREFLVRRGGQPARAVDGRRTSGATRGGRRHRRPGGVDSHPGRQAGRTRPRTVPRHDRAGARGGQPTTAEISRNRRTGRHRPGRVGATRLDPAERGNHARPERRPPIPPTHRCQPPGHPGGRQPPAPRRTVTPGSAMRAR